MSSAWDTVHICFSNIANSGIWSKITLLTIAIPTYNRSRYLDRLLGSLLPQIRELENQSKIELLISDNASSDDTETMLRAYQSDSLSFRYIRNATNVGADANILQCFNEAEGKYVWIIGDDDILLANVLNQVVDLLDREEFDIVHLRAKALLSERESPEAVGSLNIKRTESAQDFTLRIHVELTFITGNIVNKSRALSLPHEPFSKLVGTYLVQLGWTYTLLRHFRRGAYITTPVIAASGDARGGYGLFQVFGSNLKAITEDWLKTPELVRIVLNGTLQVFFPPFVLSARRGEKTFSSEQYEALLHSLFSDNLRYRLFLYPLLRFPPRLANIWFFVCRIANRVNRAAGNPLLR